MSYILSGDAAIYYEEYGSGEPLLVLPGLLGTIETHWRRFLPELARHFHTIAMDLRGHGRTNNPSGEFGLDRCVSDIHALLDTLQIEQTLLLGHDFGGTIALAYALRYPAAVRGVAVHAPALFRSPGAAGNAAAALDPERVAREHREQAEQLRSDHLPGNGPDGWRMLLEAVRAFLLTLPAEGIPPAAVSAVGCPVLILHCSDDTAVLLSEAARLTAELPAARIHLLAGCRHEIQSVPRRPLVESVVSFFRSTSPTLPA